MPANPYCMKVFLPISLMLFLCISCKTLNREYNSLDAIIEEYHIDGFYNGTILIADSNGILLEKAYGMADFARATPLEVNSTFYLASVSKQFTAMATMLLYERNQVAFDDRLTEYFPQYPSWADTVTIRHLLTHTSGIPDYYDLGLAKAGFVNADVVALAGKINKLNFRPGDRYEYSNTAYVLLSSIVQQVSGMGFNEFMQENVFRPLAMTSTVAYDETKPERKNRCKGFNADGNEDDYPYYTTGGGGIYSNVGDLYKWQLALQKYRLVSAATFAEALKPMKLNDGELSYYGFGWMLDKDNAGRIFHTGTLTSFRTYIESDQPSGRVIIMLNNVGRTRREELLEAITRHLNQKKNEV